MYYIIIFCNFQNLKTVNDFSFCNHQQLTYPISQLFTEEVIRPRPAISISPSSFKRSKNLYAVDMAQPAFFAISFIVGLTRLFFMYSLIYSYILIFVSSFFALIGVSPKGEIIFVFELYHKGKSITTTTCPD